MGMNAKLAADHSFLNRPGQATFVLLKTAGYQLLFFGHTLAFLAGCLLLDDILDFAVEFIGFFLLFALLGQQVLLFFLELLQHGLVLALVACQVLGLASLVVQRLLFLHAIGLQQSGLNIYLGLRVLDACHLLLAVALKLLQVTDTPHSLVEILCAKHEQQGRLHHVLIVGLPNQIGIIGLESLQRLLKRVTLAGQFVHL